MTNTITRGDPRFDLEAYEQVRQEVASSSTPSSVGSTGWNDTVLDSLQALRQTHPARSAEDDRPRTVGASIGAYLFSSTQEESLHDSPPDKSRETSSASASASASEDDGHTLWGVNKEDYEAVQRDEGMPSLEEESLPPSGSSAKGHVASTGSNDSSSRDSGRSLRSESSPSLMDEVRALLASGASGKPGSEGSSSEPVFDDPWKKSARSVQVSGAGIRARSTPRSPRQPGQSESEWMQSRARWIPPTGRAPNLPTIEDTDLEGDFPERLEAALRNAGNVHRRRFTAEALDMASRLRKEASYQALRSEIRSARSEPESAVLSVSSNSSSSTDSVAVPGLEGTAQPKVSTDGAGLHRSGSSMLDELRGAEPKRSERPE